MTDQIESYFTPAAHHALKLAQQEAKRGHHSQLGIEHLLVGLLQEEDGIAGRVLRGLGMDLKVTRERLVIPKAEDDDFSLDKVELSPELERAFKLAANEAFYRRIEDKIDTEHLLLGLLRQRPSILSLLLRRKQKSATTIFAEFGISSEEIRAQIEKESQNSRKKFAGQAS
jgi:ATP-dependent Clp protease ATP-binding subunit ClpC